MPSFTSFILNDGTNDHTFTPVAINTAKSVLVAREGTTAAGNPTVITGLKLATNSTDSNKVSVRVNFPHEDTVDSVVEVRDTSRFIGEWILPNRRTPAEREAFANLVGAAVAHALIAAYVEDLDPLYGG